MLWTLRALLLVLFASISVEAQTRTLALYAGPVHGLHAQASRTMLGELQRLLEPAGLDVVWKDLADRKADDNFELVAVSSFEGSCAMDQPVSTTTAAVSLADTSISNGHVLPFFHVDCPR